MTYWTDRNRPESHPLWAEQVLLERTMLTTGADQYRATVNKARERGAMDSLKPYRRITEEMLPKVSEAIGQWREYHAKPRRGARHIAYEAAKSIPDDLLAYLTLRAVLNQLTTGSANFTDTALEVGIAAEHEARLLAWRARDTELFDGIEKSLRDPDQPDRPVGRASVLAAMREEGVVTLAAVQQRLKDQKATAVHRRRVLVNRFNKEVRDKGDWLVWSHRQRLQVGVNLLGILAESTGRFERVLAATWEPRKPRPYAYMMDPELQDWLSNGLEREELLHPFYTPTIIPPRDWTTLTDGGYHTDLLPQRLMIRFKADHEEQRRRAVADMSSVEMPVAYAALNTAQSVPWRINERVFEVAVVAWANDLQLAKLPRKARFPDAFRDASIPPKGQTLTEDQEALLQAYKRAQAKVEGDNARLAARIFKTDRLLDTAERFVGQEFYFPHVLDFRGRMYPIPVDLNPQGEDLARGLLTFANGRPVDEDAAKWLAIQVCNTFGHDKVPFEERVQWTLGREETWRRIAADPLANREWAASKGPDKVSDPWQHLAAILEWVRYLEEGPGMVSALPIRIDGTCNGIQHLSAMIRDEEGGASVNLTPGYEPHDIYREVGELVEAELRRVSSQDEASLVTEREVGRHDAAVSWLHALGGTVPRSLAKRPVMILPYGGTREAARKSILEWMDKEGQNRGTALFDEERRYTMAGFLADVMMAVVRRKLTRAVSVQEWLQDVAKLTADNSDGAPLTWFTPVGFLVRQFYGQRQETKIKTAYDSGDRIKIVHWETTAELDRKRQLQGIAPNFTHAMDAAVLMETIRWAKSARLTEFTAIHDAYGTVAADVALLHAGLRRAFVKLYAEHDPLGDFLAACQDTAKTYRRAKGLDENLEWPARPTEGTLDIRQVMSSYYFVA